MRDIICEIKFRLFSRKVFFFLLLSSREKNLIGLSIELRRRKSCIGRIKKNASERERERKERRTFFSPIDRKRKETKAYPLDGNVDLAFLSKEIASLVFFSPYECPTKKKKKETLEVRSSFFLYSHEGRRNNAESINHNKKTQMTSRLNDH